MNRQEDPSEESEEISGEHVTIPESQKKAILGIVFITIFLDFGGFSVLFPVLPIYASTLGAGPREIGLMMSLYAIAMLLFAPVWGFVGDRIGRRPVLLISLAGTVVSFVCLALADSINGIYFARTLSGFFAATIGTAQAVVTDITIKTERTRGMAVIGAAFGAGMTFGPFLGGSLAKVNAQLPFFAVAGLATVNWLFAFWKLPESRPRDLKKPPWNEFGRAFIPVPYRLITAQLDTKFKCYLVLFFQSFTAFAVLESMVTLYARKKFGVGEWEAGLFFGWVGVCLTLTQGLLLRKLVPLIDELKLTISGLLLMALAIGVIPFLDSMTGCIGVGTVLAVGYGIAFPSLTSMFSKICTAENAGELLGQSQSMATTGRIVGPVLAGMLMHHIGLGAPFIGAGILMALAAFLLWKWKLKIVPS